MTDFTEMNVADLAGIIKAKQASPVEIANAFLSRIEAVNGRLNAFVTVDQEGAIATAKKAEAEIQGGTYLGPLHGVPVAYKDLYATAGLRTTGGGSRVLEKPCARRRRHGRCPAQASRYD
jgi:aspartyl-tRNA(Asn)/glutamyl-tRNA(Gln) amidotransferase subunit A